MSTSSVSSSQHPIPETAAPPQQRHNRRSRKPLAPAEALAKGDSLRGAGTHRRFRRPQAVENVGAGKSQFSGPASHKPTEGHLRHPRTGCEVGLGGETGPADQLSLLHHPVVTLLGILVLLLGIALPAQAAEYARDGRELARQVHDRSDGKDAAATAVMYLTQKGRDSRQRTLAVLRKDKGTDERWSFIRFYEPADIAQTGLLTKDYPHGDSNQWLYLPALGRVRRISSSDKGGRFVGSDFYYEDLQRRAVNKDDHRLLGTASIGRIRCEVLQSTPKDPSSSAYSKRVAWVHPASLVPLQVDFYQGGNRPTKRLKVRRLKRIQGIWTVMDSIMYDLRTGHQTRLALSGVRYNQGLPDSLFTTEALEDPTADRRYTP